jgi:hypothetical protein
MICGNKKVKKEWLSAINQAQSPKGKPSPLNHQVHICCNDTSSFKIIQRRRRERFPREVPLFPSILGALLEMLKGHISKIGETVLQTS